MPSDPRQVNVLMVCLGICRSPMAEAVLKHQITLRPDLAKTVKINVDSAGTGAYHAGEEADDRTVAICRKHGVPISCTARKVVNDDYTRFDYILAMDQSNLQNLQHRAPKGCRAYISLFGAFDTNRLASTTRSTPASISDPYYGGSSGFQECYNQCLRYAEGFLDVLEGKAQLPEQ